MSVLAIQYGVNFSLEGLLKRHFFSEKILNEEIAFGKVGIIADYIGR